jgi:hypothetical protein
MKGPVLARDPTIVTGRRDVHSNNLELGIDEAKCSYHRRRLQPAHSGAVRMVEEDDQEH